ncbi:MAG: NADH-quinone oxidoreductase subunit M [Pseudomonadota bacterium]
MNSLLSVVTYLPALAALILLIFLRGKDAAAHRNARVLALVASTATFVISLAIYNEFELSDTGFQMVEQYSWPLGFTYKVGADGLSLFLILMTTALMPIAVGTSWPVAERVKEYMILFLMMETWVLLALTALDITLFFVALEAGLITGLLLVGGWGGKGAMQSAVKGWIHSLPGTVLLAAAFALIWAQAGSTDIEVLLAHSFSTDPMVVVGLTLSGGMQTLLFLALLAAFALKMPVWPFHGWALSAQATASTGTALLMAVIFAKVGAYGLLRFNVSMLPVAADGLAWLGIALGLVTTVFCAVAALRSEDLRRLLAYLSLAHLGIILIGMFALNRHGLDGMLLQMVIHGVVFAGLFVCAGILQDRAKSVELDAFGGLIERMPMLALAFMVLSFSALGLPATAGFSSVFLTLTGAATVDVILPLIVALSLVVGGGALLWAYRRIIFGVLMKQALQSVRDLSVPEVLMLLPILVIVIALGVSPGLVLDTTEPAVTQLLETHNSALEEVGTINLTQPAEDSSN